MAKIVKQAPSFKTPVYNGTHGNLSVNVGEIKKFGGADGDVYELFELGIGVRLIEAKLYIKDSLGGGKVQLQLVKSSDGSLVEEITKAVDATAVGVTSSDDALYFPPLPDFQEELIVQVVISDADITPAKALRYQAFTQSVGNA